MAQYNLSHTGQQLDAAVEKYLQTDFNSFIDSATLNNYVTTAALNTTLSNYLPANVQSNTGVFLRGDNTWSNILNTSEAGITGDTTASIRLKVIHQTTGVQCGISIAASGSNHGVWSNGYSDGTTFTDSASWLIFRNNRGQTIISPNNNVGIGNTDPQQKVHVGGLLAITNYDNTVTIGSQNVNYCHFTNSANIPFYFNKSVYVDGNIFIYNNYAYSLQRGGVGTAWVGGRNGALVKTTTISGYSATCSIKTTNGSWEIGAYDNSGYANQLIFSYVTDSNFNANNNTSVTARITPAGAFTNASKREYKENIKLVDYSALDIINSTKICSFNMKGDEEKAYRVGFIADDTNPIISGKNQDVMDLQNCIGILMKAVQELSSKIDKKNK